MNVGGILVTVLVLAILIGTVLWGIHDNRHLSRAGRRLTAAVAILLIAEVWAAAYLWQRSSVPEVAAFLAAGAVVATLGIGFAIALRIDLRQRRDQADAQR